MNDLDTKLRTLARAEETPLPEGMDERLKRTLAACVCLALVGTVLAVENGIFARIVRPGDADFYDIQEDLPYELGYDVAGNWVVSTPAVPIPAEEFSQAVQDLAEEAEDQYAWTAVENWQAAEELVGVDLPQFPLLAGQQGRMIYRSGADGIEEELGSCLVEVFTDGDAAPTNVSVRAVVEMAGTYQGLSVDVDLLMATDAWTMTEFRRSLTLSPGLMENLQQSDYQTAWGGTAVVCWEGGTVWEGIVDWHGRMVSLSVSGGDQAEELLHALLDGME